MSRIVPYAGPLSLIVLAGLLAPAPGRGQGKLRVTTTSLQSGAVSSSYSQTLSATGGRQPYTWSISDRTLPAGLTLTSAGVISGTPQSAGTSPFTVQVEDTNGNSDTQALQITVGSNPAITTSTLPNATAGTPYSATLAATGAVAPVTWSISTGSLPLGLSLAPSTGVISGTPSSAGTANFTVKLTDSESGSATKALSLTVAPAPSTITTGGLPGGTVGTPYSQALAASGGTPPYTWTIATGTLPAGLTLSTSGTISGTPTAAGSSTFTIKVTDNTSASTTAQRSIAIAPAALRITTSSLPGGTAGTPYSQALAAAGGTPPYTWTVATGTLPAGLTLAANGTIAGTPAAAGSSSVTFKVTDSASVSATAALSIAIAPAALRITTSSLAGGTVGTFYSQTLAASGGTPQYTWTIATGTLPGGLTLAANGTISGTPTAAGSSSFTVKVTDNASASTTAQLSIAIAAPALSITTSSLPAGTAGTPYSQTLAAAGGTPPYTWTIATGTLPAGLTLAGNGTISGTPSTAGSSNFTVKLTDSASQSTTAQLSITIAPAALVITTSSLPAGTVGTPYSRPLAAAGGTPPYTWTIATGTLPAGLTLAANGTISGTPTAAGSSTFTVKLTDSASASATAQVSIIIAAPTLAITTSSLPAGTVATPYSQTLAASGGTPPYTWTIASGSLPAGLSLAANGTISGTPTAAGSSTFTVKLTDSASASATAQLSITIAAPTLAITTSSLPAGTVATPYSQTLAASGGTPPYTWTLASGSLSAGLTLAANGTISGTPTAAGSSTFTVKATDSGSASATAQLSITIAPATLAITTSSLPAGTVATPYSQTLAASGGTPPYTWTLATGSLPAGLSLAANGTVSGTPTAPGSSTFTVKLTDSASASATAQLSITIAAPTLAITTSSLLPGTVATPYSQTLAASGGTPPYTWTLASGSLPAGLSLAANGTISGTPTVAGSSTFSVKLTDSASASTSAPLSITIAAPTLAITTSSLLPGTVATHYSQTLAASGGTPPYTWTLASGSLPSGLILAANGIISGTPTVAGSSTFSVKLTDSASASTTASLSIMIAAPALSITTTSLPPGTVGTPYSQTLAAAGGLPPFTWTITSGSLPPGLTLLPAGTISGTPSITGSFGFAVQAADTATTKTTQALTIQIQPSPIQITTAALPPSTVGATYTQSLIATGGSPPFTWSLNSGALPPGLTLDPGGAIRGTARTPGSYTFSLQVVDSQGTNATVSYAVTVNAAVSIDTSSLADALIGAPYSQQLRAAGGTPPYTWSLRTGALPDGVAVDPNTGVISGTPTAVGSFTFTLRATDKVSAFAERQFQITTAAGLLITTAPVLPSATVGLQYAQSLNAAGGRPPYIWSISSGGLPAGIALNTADGTLAGVPSVAGAFQFTVNVSDSLGRTASKPFTLTVAAALVISSAPALPPATAGAPYSQALSVTGGTAPYMSSITSGGLPSGLSFDASTATISGTPVVAGNFTFTVQVTDSNSVTASKQFTLAVTSNLTIAATSLPQATAGVPYSFPLSATGGLAPYVWTVKSGSLPPGLAINPSNNTISGTPAANGAFAFTLQVTDASSATAGRDFTLTVSVPPVPSVSIDNLPDPANPADQPAFTVSLATPYPLQLTGQIAITFAPDAAAPADDASVQFATGGRTVNFTIPAGSTTAAFSNGQMALQTGTVAGAITLDLSLQSPKGEVTATAQRTLHVARTAPVARAVEVAHTSGGFELRITGYSTPRELTQATVQLTAAAGSNLQTTQLNIPLTDLATSWFQSAASARFGSQFVLVLPFTIQQGSAASIDSVGVTLTNKQGTSPAVTAKY